MSENRSKDFYTCPMHPTIRKEKAGICPLCGMRLVKSGDEKKQSNNPAITSPKDYLPLIVIITLIFATSLTISLKDYWEGAFNTGNTISYFMAGFFLVFSGFKLMDLKGFAEGYFTYDLLARRWYGYGYIYPFIELFFGLAMILNIMPILVLWAELIVMTFSGIGVAVKLMRREKFQCACLGTFLKVPLTKITLIEDFGMAALAATMLLLK